MAATKRSFRPQSGTHYSQALAGLSDGASFGAAVRSHLEFDAHVAQQNSLAESDGKLHPICNVPHWN
jgi:type II secretory pathway component PulF